MKVESVVAAVTVATFILAPAVSYAESAVSFEEISGSDVKRVILTQRAAERLGIETGQIGEQQIIRKQMVGGRVITPVQGQPVQTSSGGSFGGFAQLVVDTTEPDIKLGEATSPVSNDAWVLVTLSPDEWERTRKDKPARILPLETRQGPALVAQPSELLPTEDPKRTMLTAYYVVPGEDHGMTLNQRVRVELELIGTDELRMVAPYGAVYYDGTGQAWVYTNPEPLVYERRPISVERIVGDLAVLSDGPPVGTTVVTIGAALLYGAEVIYGK